MPVTDAPQEKSGFRQKTPRAPFETEPGRPHPLGATVDKEGVNFSVFSRNAISVELLLFVRQASSQTNYQARAPEPPDFLFLARLCQGPQARRPLLLPC